MSMFKVIKYEILLLSLFTITYILTLFFRSKDPHEYGNGYVDFQNAFCNHDSHLITVSTSSDCANACSLERKCMAYQKSTKISNICMLYSKCIPIEDPVGIAGYVLGIKRRKSKMTSFNDIIVPELSLNEQLYHISNSACQSIDQIQLDVEIDFDTIDNGLSQCIAARDVNNEGEKDKILAIQHSVDTQWKCLFFIRCMPVLVKEGFISNVYVAFNNQYDYCENYAKNDKNVCVENSGCLWTGTVCTNDCGSLFDIVFDQKYLVYNSGRLAMQVINDRRQFFFFRKITENEGYVELYDTKQKSLIGYLNFEQEIEKVPATTRWTNCLVNAVCNNNEYYTGESSRSGWAWE